MTRVSHNVDAKRYELDTDDGEAILQYRRHGDVLTFTHTFVPPAQEGRGVGTSLVEAALEDVRDHGWKLRSTCPFVTAYLTRHPETRDLQDASQQPDEGGSASDEDAKPWD